MLKYSFPPQHQCGMTQIAVKQQSGPAILRRSLGLMNPICVLAKMVLPGAANTHLRPAIQQRNLLGKAPRVRQVISVQPGNILAHAQPKAQIKRFRQAQPLLILHQMKTAVLMRILCHNFCATVNRAIFIYNPKVPVRKGLRQNRVDGLFYMLSPVINRHNHRNLRHNPHSKIFSKFSYFKCSIPANER